MVAVRDRSLHRCRALGRDGRSRAGADLTREGLLPGFLEGYGRIHHDETRHIGYGVWFLREQVRDRPETAEVIREMLRELLPSVAASLAPPETGSSHDFEAIGAGTSRCGRSRSPASHAGWR